ncbi:co-chaperone GroES [Saxibacter everestensis]|uniref:10 kDa chaperonin n=1 Tax=Saxibacter everestensis TaxID=2909229 RepID=A0ABY8QVF6_9MICO|nr:co-chaperone GroES [Brevibacteriaceae bacterium ZFBP1038]
MSNSPASPSGQLPIRMLHDRILAALDKDAGERKSSAGIVIPATAAMGKRLSWAEVVATGPHVRQTSVGDKVLFDPEERAEVELQGSTYVLLRERDVHAVAAPEVEDGATGLYL